MDSTYFIKNNIQSEYPNFYEIQKAFTLYENAMDSLSKNNNRVKEEEKEEGKFPEYNFCFRSNYP